MRLTVFLHDRLFLPLFLLINTVSELLNFVFKFLQHPVLQVQFLLVQLVVLFLVDFFLFEHEILINLSLDIDHTLLNVLSLFVPVADHVRAHLI